MNTRKLLSASLGSALAVCAVNGAQAQVIFDGNNTNVSLVTNFASGDTGEISTGSASDPFWFSPGGSTNNTGFSSTDNIQTLNGGSILATDTVKYTLTVLGTQDSPGGAVPSLEFWGLELGFAPASGAFRPADNALVVLDGRGSTAPRTNIGYSPTNVFGQVQNTLPGTTPAGEGIVEASFFDGFTIEITADASGFTTVVSDIETTITAATTVTLPTEPVPAGTDFVTYMNNSYFYAAAQGGGQYNVAVATIELNPSALVPGDADGDGDVDDTDLGIAISNFTGPGGTGKTVADGDTDGDGDVDDTDLGVAISGFTGPLSPAAVPEPASLAMLSLGGLLIARRRRA